MVQIWVTFGRPLLPSGAITRRRQKGPTRQAGPTKCDPKQVSFEASGLEKRLPQNMEIMLYRIIKELLNNTVKHAAANVVIVQLIKDGNRLNITVEDDGKGFNIQQTNTGTGIETVKGRVQYLNGSFNIESEENVGTTIMMEFLLTDEQHD